MIVQRSEARPPFCLSELTVYGDIPEWSFVTVYGLKKLTLIDTTVIGVSAFHDLTYLKEVSLPDCLEVIESGAFARCKALEQISIPKGVKVAEDAFRDCPLLK